MRELTQKEIDDKPEWATHYVICDYGDVMWESKDNWLSGTSGKDIQQDGLSSDAIPILSNQSCKFEHSFKCSRILSDSEAGDEHINIYTPRNTAYITKDDVTAMAKYFKLI